MIVDSLVVELGLDPSKFTKGQKEALDSYKRTREALVEGGKDIEYQAGRTGEAIGGIRTATLGMFATLTGTAGLVQFASQAIHAGAAAGRLSRNINVSVDTITKFQGLATVFGGSAEGMAQSFVQMSDALAGWKVGDVRQIIADYRALGAAGGTIIDINKGVDETILDIAKNLRAIHDKDPQLAGYWQRRLGLDPGLYDAMIQKNETFAEQLKKITGLTNEEAEAAGRLERRWNQLTNNLTKGSQGLIIDLADSKSKFNPLNNGSDEQDIKMIAGWINKVFGTHYGEGSPAPATPSGAGAFTSSAEKEAFIRQSAATAGIDPDVAVAVAKSEGFSKFTGDNGTSFGAFQLHVTPGGRGAAVGDQFKSLTGLDPSNQANERETIMFALEWAKRHGWGDFHGAARTHVSEWQGIGGGGSHTSTSIAVNGPVNIYPPPGTDGKAMAGTFIQTLKNQSFAAQANTGQN